MGRFDGMAAWVTGAGSGIGRAVAEELARQGADVAVSGRRADRLEETVAAIAQLGRRALPLPCDVTDDDAVALAANRVAEHFGRLDVVVANAGMGVNGWFTDLTAADWRQQMDVNVHGVVNTARHALPHLKKSRGRLVLVGSVSALVAAPTMSAYCASKFAVRAIGLTLSQELAPDGVSCTTVHPGFVASEIGQVDNKGVHDPSRKDPRPHALMWPTERAARVVVGAIYKRKREFVFTGHGRFAGWVGQHFPGFVNMVMGSPRAQAGIPRKKQVAAAENGLQPS